MKNSNEIRWQVDAIILHGGLGVTSEALLARGTWNLAAKTNEMTKTSCFFYTYPWHDPTDRHWEVYIRIQLNKASTNVSLVVWGPVLWDSRGTR